VQTFPARLICWYYCQETVFWAEEAASLSKQTWLLYRHDSNFCVDGDFSVEPDASLLEESWFYCQIKCNHCITMTPCSGISDIIIRQDIVWFTVATNNGNSSRIYTVCSSLWHVLSLHRGSGDVLNGRRPIPLGSRTIPELQPKQLSADLSTNPQQLLTDRPLYGPRKKHFFILVSRCNRSHCVENTASSSCVLDFCGCYLATTMV
jgi:hypothetical protein